MEQKIAKSMRVNSLESSVYSTDNKLDNFIIDQYEFNELTQKKISDLTESTA